MWLLEQNIPARRENGKTGPAQENCACSHVLQSLSCRHQLIMGLLFRAAICFFGTGPRWSTADSAFWSYFNTLNASEFTVAALPDPPGGVQLTERGRTIMLISFFLFLSMSCCYDLQQVTPLFLCFLSSHGHNSCFLIPSFHPLISPLILIPLC